MQTRGKRLVLGIILLSGGLAFCYTGGNAARSLIRRWRVDEALGGLSASESHVRRRSAHVIGLWCSDMDPDQRRTAFPALRVALRDPDARVRMEALWAIGCFGPDAAAAVPDITERLKDDDERIRFDAVSALEVLGASAGDAVPALAESASDEFAGVHLRRAAKQAIESIRTAAAK